MKNTIAYEMFNTYYIIYHIQIPLELFLGNFFIIHFCFLESITFLFEDERCLSRLDISSSCNIIIVFEILNECNYAFGII